MTLHEAHTLLADHQKWRTSQPPYHFDPDADEWAPIKPIATPSQLTEAIETVLCITRPLCNPRPLCTTTGSPHPSLTFTPSPIPTGGTPSAPPEFAD